MIRATERLFLLYKGGNMVTIEVINHWRNVRAGLYAALDKLNDAQLAFVPREGLWSLGTVVCHLAGAEDGWFRYALRRELPDWPDYPAASYPTIAALKALLSETHGRTEGYLAAASEEELDRNIVLPWGGQICLREAAWHVLEHEIHHRGEVFLMLGLQGMEAPDI
jgi:uncharacterized damage-inducible protein DinB